MFQLLRRVSGSFLPRPDRPWSDDVTSLAPTIGRKRRYTVTEQDDSDSASMAKRIKSDPAKPDAACDSASDGESTKADAAPALEGEEVKDVTKGVKEVVLEDRAKAEDGSPVRPEGVPLPDSPSGSPVPEPTEPDAGEGIEGQEHADEKGPTPSSVPDRDAEDTEDTSDAKAVATNTDTADETAPAQEVDTEDLHVTVDEE